MTTTRLIAGLGQIADDYDGFILDQWGVLHNGSQAFPGAFATLARLKAAGKRIALLSNSGRRTATNRARLAEMGFDVAMFDGIVTSGEATWQVLASRSEPPWSGLGRRCYLVTIGDDLGPVEGAGLKLVDRIEDADFLYMSGLEGRPAEELMPLARAAAALRLPMVCSNPDRIAVTASGPLDAPGKVAAAYQEMGQTVHFVGKPHAPIYRACLAALDGVAPERILCVGDSLEHDIAGAKGMGLAACFLTSGIHEPEFPQGMGDAAALALLAKLAGEHGAVPDYMALRFAW